MQTFLPYPSFARSLRTLDVKRLGKQRVETMQIISQLTGMRIDPVASKLVDPTDYREYTRLLTPVGGGWGNHPMTRMWRGYELALTHYGLINCRLWMDLGYRDTCYRKIRAIMWSHTMREINNAPRPPWFGDPDFHRSHQSNLVRKDADFYGPQFPDVPADLPYVWPV